MKFIKTYKIFENSDLISKLEEFKIKNYTIDNDSGIDVKGSVNLHQMKLNRIPLKFHEVTGNFYCYDNQLNSLEGCPVKIGERFDCSYNQLTSLENCPLEIEENFDCSSNKLTSLEYCPSEIGKHFYCSWNELTMLDCSSYVKGNIICWGMFEQEPEFFGDCEGKILWKL